MKRQGFVFAVVLAAVTVSSVQARAQSRAPDGPWFGFGLNAGGGIVGGAGLRLEVGLPLKEVGPGLLSINLPLSSRHGGYGSCFGYDPCPKWRWNALYFVPEVQWEYSFRFDWRHRFSVLGLAGAGLAMYWQYYRDFQGLGTGRNVNFGVVPFRTGVAARLTFESGWMVQVLPVGFTMNMSFGHTYYYADYVVGNHDVDFFVTYDFWAMGGYRW